MFEKMIIIRFELHTIDLLLIIAPYNKHKEGIVITVSDFIQLGILIVNVIELLIKITKNN